MPMSASERKRLENLEAWREQQIGHNRAQEATDASIKTDLAAVALRVTKVEADLVSHEHEATPPPPPPPDPEPEPEPEPPPPPSGTVPFGSRPASAAISLKGQNGVTISGKTFKNLGAGVIAIRLENCTNIMVLDCDFDTVAECIYAVGCTDLIITGNRYSNITGPAQPRTGANVANFVQLNGCQRVLIGRNKGKGGDTEDIVSVYKSSNVIVEDNHFEGTNWTSGSGSGIALGDDGGSGNIARRNILVNPGQVGIFIAGGTNSRIEDNIVIGETRPKSNVGVYVWNQYSTKACSGHTVARNRVSWKRADGINNPYWNAGNCGPVAGDGNIWTDGTLRADDYRVIL